MPRKIVGVACIKVGGAHDFDYTDSRAAELLKSNTAASEMEVLLSTILCLSALVTGSVVAQTGTYFLQSNGTLRQKTFIRS